MSKDPKSKDKGEQLALPGVPLEQRQAVWREHTAERFQERDPDAYSECVEAIKNGETNKTHLSKRFAVSRQTLRALMMKEFSVEQLQAINAKRAAMLAGEALEKADEVVEKATKRELGALAMVSKTAFEIGQLGSGGPTSRHEERVVFSVEDFTREVGPGTGSEAGKVSALPPGGAVPGPMALPESREAELVPLSGTQPLHENVVTSTTPTNSAALILLFIPVCAWVLGGNFGAVGFLNRGGGGRALALAAQPSISSATGNFLALPTAAVRSRAVPSAPEGC